MKTRNSAASRITCNRGHTRPDLSLSRAVSVWREGPSLSESMPECEELDFELLPDCEEVDFEPLPECEVLDFELPVPVCFASWLQPPGSPLELPELPGFAERASRIGILAACPELLVVVELEFLSRESDLFFISRLQLPPSGGVRMGCER